MRSTFIAQSGIIAGCLSLLLVCVRYVAADAAPASQPGSTELIGTVTGVQGMVQVRMGPDQPWQKCTVGLAVGQGAEFRTGLASAVQFTIPPDQTVTLDRLGTVTLLQAVESNGKVTTDLGMKYGRTRYEIEAAGIQHVSTIHSPNSTLAVRGTTVSLTDQRPFPPEAISLTGTAQYSTAKRQMAVGGKGTGTAKAVGDLPPAQTALFSSVIDPSSSYSRTAAESQLVTTVISHGAVVSEQNSFGIPIVTGGIPPSDAQILATQTDPLIFILQWTGNSNLDLYVNAPQNASGQKNFLLYPAPGLNIAPNGAKIPFDDRGGPHGGFEIAAFPGPVIDGNYGFGVNYVSGQPTALTAEAFLNNVPVQLFTGNLFSTSTQLTGTVGPRPQYVNTTGAIALVGGNNLFGGGGIPGAAVRATVVRPMGPVK